MRTLRARALGIGLLLAVPAFAVGLCAYAPTAQASVSISIAFDSLVKESSAVAIVSPLEETATWEDGRIVTYTRVRVDTTIAGGVAVGDELWVRTLGGVVDHVGQLVDGEAVLTKGHASLLFLRPSRLSTGLEVTARGQGQYPVKQGESRELRITRSASAGLLLPPKSAQPALHATTSQAPALASDLLHNMKVPDAAKAIAEAWKRLHAP